MTEAPKPFGLRERQRRAIEAELRAAALKLFGERGFDEVSVAEIAAEAGISERTFFRHFPTKEDVVLTLMEGYGLDIISRLESQPLDRPWFDVLRNTYTGAYDVEVTMAGERSEELRRSTAQVLKLAQGSTRLRAGIDARARTWQDDIARIVARRLGVDIDQDPRPRVWGAVAIIVGMANAERHAAIDGSLGVSPAEAWDALAELLKPPTGT
ncbi:putative DNA-binding transcriptional repressor AcrR [Frankia canadensis]|uniref:Putative DNA-binding transcriptional repressor AcrR n=1 Tax=Frankia canadensis TaxID=1836972 RepID=A0A2I2KSC5_9ACTN|nr:TetR family transcriptional regulator [Frankia canadensis]SNQ48565.1 putative DNA-binding transcriptional repressor AcrR [Frankia canadensis]SOU55855.1 putative DNA-binding transcriptional repressor AcrR [Frankia canadensis]